MAKSSLIPRKPMFGIGARICVVLSAALLLLDGWSYKDNFDSWSEYNRCQKIISNIPLSPLPSIQFHIAKFLDTSQVTAGKEMYIACPHSKVVLNSDPLPPGCSTFVMAEPGDEQLRFLIGPTHATRSQIDDAASRLGMNGELSKVLADESSRPPSIYPDPQKQAAYLQCQQRTYFIVPEKPTIDVTALVPFLWIWGIYGTVRFIRGK